MYPHFIRTLLALPALLACSAAHAVIPAFQGYAAASDAELDKMRGGFELNLNGMHLMLAFSLEQLTYINGELVSSMKLNPIQLTLPTAPEPVTTITAAPTQTPTTTPAPTNNPVSSPTVTPPAPSQIGQPPGAPPPGTVPATVATQVLNNQGVITLIQNGAGNNFSLPQSLSSLSTVIQNTVNDQVIRNLTVLNATLSLQQAAAAARLGATLNQALSASVPH